MIFAGVGVQLVGERALLCDLAVRDRGFERGANQRGVDEHLGDLLLDMPFARQSVGLRHQLRKTDELIALLCHCGESAQPLPQPERMREDGGLLDSAVEEDTFIRHEDVVEDHESFRHVDFRRDREGARVGMARREGRVDYLDAGRVDRHCASDRVRLLAGLHRLGRDHHQVMRHRRARDVELGAADHDPIATPLDHPRVGVGIVLFAGRTGTIALGVRDAFDDTNVLALRGLHVIADALRIFRQRVRDARRRSGERHDRLVGDVGDDVGFEQQRDPIAQFIRRSRDRHQRADCAGLRRVELVVALRYSRHAFAKQRMIDEVAHALAFEIGFAVVVERLLVLLSGHHRGFLSLSFARAKIYVAAAVATSQKPSAERPWIKGLSHPAVDGIDGRSAELVSSRDGDLHARLRPLIRLVEYKVQVVVAIGT